MRGSIFSALCREIKGLPTFVSDTLPTKFIVRHTIIKLQCRVEIIWHKIVVDAPMVMVEVGAMETAYGLTVSVWIQVMQV